MSKQINRRTDQPVISGAAIEQEGVPPAHLSMLSVEEALVLPAGLRLDVLVAESLGADARAALHPYSRIGQFALTALEVYRETGRCRIWQVTSPTAPAAGKHQEGWMVFCCQIISTSDVPEVYAEGTTVAEAVCRALVAHARGRM